MRIGVINGPAGNHHMLQVVDGILDERGVDLKVCLGGIAGVYPGVAECFDFLVARGYVILVGHVDRTFATDGPYDLWSMHYLVASLEAQGAVVDRRIKDALGDLWGDYRVEGIDFLAVDFGDSPPLNTPQEALASMVERGSRICVSAQMRGPAILDLSNLPLAAKRESIPSVQRTVRLHDDRHWFLAPGRCGSLYLGSDFPTVLILDTTGERTAPGCTAEIIDLSQEFVSDIGSLVGIPGCEGLVRFLRDHEHGTEGAKRRRERG